MPGSEPTTAISVCDLARIYTTTLGIFRRTRHQISALEQISFTVEPGELFGIVGPNGAGKSTLIKILTTLLLPTSGRAFVLGLDVAHDEHRLRQRINVVFGGERGLYTRLSAEDNLYYFADLYRLPRALAAQRVPQLIEMVGLRGREKERVEGYSKGMKQRLHIAKAMINDPEVLFLDEPTIGLDVTAARKLHELVRELRALGKTIVLTSHYMHEIDTLCRRIAVINQGRLITIDTPYNLKRFVAKLFVVEARLNTHLDEELLTQLRAHPSVEQLTLTPGDHAYTLTVHTQDPDAAITLLRHEVSADALHYLVTREPTLEDAYLKLIGAEV